MIENLELLWALQFIINGNKVIKGKYPKINDCHGNSFYWIIPKI